MVVLVALFNCNSNSVKYDEEMLFLAKYICMYNVFYSNTIGVDLSTHVNYYHDYYYYYAAAPADDADCNYNNY